MRPAQLLAAVVAMSSVSHALSDAFDNIHGLADVKHALFGRQDGKSEGRNDFQDTYSPSRQTRNNRRKHREAQRSHSRRTSPPGRRAATIGTRPHRQTGRAARKGHPAARSQAGPRPPALTPGYQPAASPWSRPTPLPATSSTKSATTSHSPGTTLRSR